MESRTITINIRKDVEEQFRQAALSLYGKQKGYLGKAATDAMREWTVKKEASTVNARALQLLQTGFHLGGMKSKKRSEWYDR